MRALSVLACCLALFFSVSCVIAVVDPRRPEHPNISLGRFERELPLKSGGSVSLENTAGDIKIEGWDEESVEVVVEENIGFPPSARFYFLGWGHPKPDVRIEGNEEEIRIRIPRSEKKDDRRLFDCRLKVPRSVNLREIRNGAGDMQISGIYGSARLSGKEGAVRLLNFSGHLEVVLEKGTIEAELLDLRPQDEVAITVDDGDIALYLEPGIGAELEAEAPEGEVASEFDVSEPLPAKAVTAKLGEGGARISLTARRGNLKIKKIEE
jgi:hypothetical protein